MFTFKSDLRFVQFLRAESDAAMEMVEGQNQHKICPKRIKFKEIEDKGEVDRLSALPDCLLVDILSRLPFTKYVFSTCILSKRWKHLWTLIPTLIFRDRGSCFPRSEFYSFVDKALTQRPQSKLKRFQVNTGYHIQYESQVNSWIRYAISCNVEELILKLYTVSEAEYQLDQFVYISSCFTDLTLEGCILNPAGAISWKNLRSLSISNGKLDEDVIENILSGSPVLETLELDKCFGYKLLDITSRSVKNLVFSGYRDLDHYEWEFVEVIEINAPNISSLTIKGESSESSVSARKKEVEGQIHRKFRAKRMRFKKIEEKGEVDRVSALPDSLLVEILSRLPSTKNAFSTCIPFKRWKHVWTLIPILIFTDGDSHRPEFYSFVDKALAQRPQSKLKKLKVVATYNDKLELPFNNWIRYAISCNVEQLIFKLDWYWGTVYELDRIFYISSCFTDLTLEGCISNPNGAISWKNLRSLCITYGKLDEDLIENILSGSPLLETLVLDRCYGYRRLDITSKSVKNLVFCGYKDLDLDEWEFAEVIEINAPNISSLTIEYELCLWKLLLLNMTSLIEAKLNYANHYLMSENLEEEMLKGFIVNLCHVKELKIGRCCSKVLSRLVAKGFDIPSNVKLSDGDSSESESDEDN